MSRPEPIEYAERLYAAIRDADSSPISFLAFGNAEKEGVPMRNMPGIAAEPFMRVVGEMLQLEEEPALIDATEVPEADSPESHALIPFASGNVRSCYESGICGRERREGERR